MSTSRYSIYVIECCFCQVTVPKGSLCSLNVEVDVGLPPDAVYNIVTDPDNRRVFKNIKVGYSNNELYCSQCVFLQLSLGVIFMTFEDYHW